MKHENGREKSIPHPAKEVGGFDLTLEATGSPRVAFDSALALRENGILSLLGVPREKHAIPIEGMTSCALVLKNACVLGSVNSSGAHFTLAMQLLGKDRERWAPLLDD